MDSVPPEWPDRGQSKTREVFEIYPGLAPQGPLLLIVIFTPAFLFLFYFYFCTEYGECDFLFWMSPLSDQSPVGIVYLSTKKTKTSWDSNVPGITA